MIPTPSHDHAPLAATDSRSSRDARARTAGVIIIAASVVTLAFFAGHPSIHSHDLAEVTAEVARVAMRNMVVHGVLIAVMAAFIVGFWRVADQLAGGSGRISRNLEIARAGLVAYALGALAMIGAATLNGFVVTALAVTYRDADPARLEPLRGLLVLCHAGNATLDVIGVIGMSLGVGLWSLGMAIDDRGGTRVIGIAGLIAGFALPVALIAGHAATSLHGMGVFLLAQVAWNLAVAVQLIRGRI